MLCDLSRCYTPQGGASPLLSAEYRQTGTGSFHAWRSRATTAAVLSRAVLPRRSQLSVGCTGGSMFCDLSLAAAAAPMGVVRLRRPQLCDVSRKRRQRSDRPWVFTRGGAPSHRAPEGRAAAGAWEFRPRSCVRSAGGGCPRTSPPLGVPGGSTGCSGGFRPPMFHVRGRRARSRSARPSPFSLPAGGIRRHVSAVRARPQ